jgi:hypothetical protein
MKSKKECELCAVDAAAPNGVLCAACREAIVRLLVIREQELHRQGEPDQLEEVVVYPERTKRTRQAGS